MLRRFPSIAAPLALTLMTATQALAVAIGSTTYTPFHVKLPTLEHRTCYTQAVFATPTGTTSQLIGRFCEASEKTGAIKVVYAG